LGHTLSDLLRHIQTTDLFLGLQGELGLIVEASCLN
jgi:hypothetical protein